MAISWPWPRDICLLPSRSELVALDLDIELDRVDVVGIAGLGIFAVTRLRFDLAELDAELDVLHPLGFGSTHAFAARLCSLATELEVLGQMVVRRCRLATELEVLARIAVLLLSSTTT
jgi:hypothetical protein